MRLRALLQDFDLHKTYLRGLCGYTVLNMVIAHLLVRGYTLENGGSPEEDDLGRLLSSCLDHFGNQFDPVESAICIRRVSLIP